MYMTQMLSLSTSCSPNLLKMDAGMPKHVGPMKSADSRSQGRKLASSFLGSRDGLSTVQHRSYILVGLLSPLEDIST